MIFFNLIQFNKMYFLIDIWVFSNGHLLTHRNKKPYECKAEGCGKSYCDARSLRRHTDQHHSNLQLNSFDQSQHTGATLTVVAATNINDTLHDTLGLTTSSVSASIPGGSPLSLDGNRSKSPALLSTQLFLPAPGLDSSLLDGSSSPGPTDLLALSTSVIKTEALSPNSSDSISSTQSAAQLKQLLSTEPKNGGSSLNSAYLSSWQMNDTNTSNSNSSSPAPATPTSSTPSSTPIKKVSYTPIMNYTYHKMNIKAP